MCRHSVRKSAPTRETKTKIVVHCTQTGKQAPNHSRAHSFARLLSRCHRGVSVCVRQVRLHEQFKLPSEETKHLRRCAFATGSAVAVAVAATARCRCRFTRCTHTVTGAIWMGRFSSCFALLWWGRSLREDLYRVCLIFLCFKTTKFQTNQFVSFRFKSNWRRSRTVTTKKLLCFRKKSVNRCKTKRPTSLTQSEKREREREKKNQNPNNSNFVRFVGKKSVP